MKKFCLLLMIALAAPSVAMAGPGYEAGEKFREQLERAKRAVEDAGLGYTGRGYSGDLNGRGTPGFRAGQGARRFVEESKDFLRALRENNCR